MYSMRNHRGVTNSLTSFVLSFCLLASFACSQDPQKAKLKYLESGRKYLKEKKYREASIEFRNALQADPGFVDAHYQLGLTYMQLSQYREAYQEFVRVADLKP